MATRAYRFLLIEILCQNKICQLCSLAQLLPAYLIGSICRFMIICVHLILHPGNERNLKGRERGIVRATLAILHSLVVEHNKWLLYPLCALFAKLNQSIAMTIPSKGNSRIGRVFGAPHHIKVHIESNPLRIGNPLLRKIIRSLHSALLSIPGTKEHRMSQRGFTLPEDPCKLQERSHAGGIIICTRMNPWNGIRRALYH